MYTMDLRRRGSVGTGGRAAAVLLVRHGGSIESTGDQPSRVLLRLRGDHHGMAGGVSGDRVRPRSISTPDPRNDPREARMGGHGRSVVRAEARRGQRAAVCGGGFTVGNPVRDRIRENGRALRAGAASPRLLVNYVGTRMSSTSGTCRGSTRARDG